MYFQQTGARGLSLRADLDGDVGEGGVVVAAVVVRLRHDVAEAEDRTQRVVVAIVVAAAQIFLVVVAQNVSPRAHTHTQSRVHKDARYVQYTTRNARKRTNPIFLYQDPNAASTSRSQ